MGKAKLDKSRSFGTIIGPVDDDVRYRQDGKGFDGQGNELVTGKLEVVKHGASIPVSSGNSGTTTPPPAKKRRKRRTKAQMAAARKEKQGDKRLAVLSTEVFK